MTFLGKACAAVVACAVLGFSADGASAASKRNSGAGNNPTQTTRASGGSSFNVWKPGKNKLPRLSSNPNTIAIEHIKMENEGFLVDRPAKKKK